MDQQDVLHIYGVAFSDATHGWIVGDDYDAGAVPTQFGAIAVTADGGSSWAGQAPGTLAILTSIATTDATHAWVGGLGNAGLPARGRTG